MSLKDNIKTIRELRGLSVEQLADRMGIGKANIYNWQNGTNKPDIDSLTALSRALDVTVNDLLAENITQAQMATDNKEKPLGVHERAMMALQQALNEDSPYRVVPKSILEGKYALYLETEIQDKNNLLWIGIKAKDELINQLKDEIKELRDRLSGGPPQKAE